jgi:hypothetical protein
MKAFLCVLAMVIATAMAQKQTQPDPCQAKSKIVADETYCDRYWECVDGRAEQFECPNGLVFAGKGRGLLENCNYPWAVSNSCDNKQLAATPISTGVCDWQYGIFGHESSCIRYWTCWNGTAVEQFCIGGLLYNEDKHACDWPEAVEGCQKHPLCKDDPNGNVPLGKSCNRYWACQGGYPRLQRCPATLVFDKTSLRCVNPPTADCEAPPPAPVEEEEGAQNVPNRGAVQEEIVEEAPAPPPRTRN